MLEVGIKACLEWTERTRDDEYRKLFRIRKRNWEIVERTCDI